MSPATASAGPAPGKVGALRIYRSRQNEFSCSGVGSEVGARFDHSGINRNISASRIDREVKAALIYGPQGSDGCTGRSVQLLQPSLPTATVGESSSPVASLPSIVPTPFAAAIHSGTAIGCHWRSTESRCGTRLGRDRRDGRRRALGGTERCVSNPPEPHPHRRPQAQSHRTCASIELAVRWAGLASLPLSSFFAYPSRGSGGAYRLAPLKASAAIGGAECGYYSPDRSGPALPQATPYPWSE